MLIISAGSTEVTGDTISGNKSYAVGLVALTDFPNFFGTDSVRDIPTVPENSYFHNNTFDHNGYDPDPEVVNSGFKVRDLL